MKNFLKNPLCKTCSYCRSFYSVFDSHQDEINKKKIERYFPQNDKNNLRCLARNVTQEFYYVNFDGKIIDLNDNDLKNDLQKSCLVHLKKIRKKRNNYKSKNDQSFINTFDHSKSTEPSENKIAYFIAIYLKILTKKSTRFLQKHFIQNSFQPF